MTARAQVTTVALLAVTLAGGAARAQAHHEFLERNILSGGGPSTTGVPVSQPFFTLWSAEVTPAAGLLVVPIETGGVSVDLSRDPRRRWVYAASRDGRVVCLVDGVPRWSVDVGGALLAPPVVHGESVVVGTGEGVLHVLNKVTGERRSRAILGEELITQPVVVEGANGALRAYVGSSAESLFAVDLELGQKLWRAHRDPPAGFSVRGFARPIVAGDTVFAAYADGALVALDAANGAPRWEKRLSPPGELVDVDALTTNGQVLFATSYTGGVYALDPSSGAMLWRTPLPGASRIRISGSMLYATAPGVLVAMRAGDGVVAWKFQIREPNLLSTPIVTENLVVVSESDGPLYFVDKRSGAPEGLFGTGDGFSAPPAAAGNVLYALSNGGRLYALAIVR